MSKRAFIIAATINTGSRYLTRVFKNHDCYGDGPKTLGNFKDRGRLDKNIWPSRETDIVWKTHVGCWEGVSTFSNEIYRPGQRTKEYDYNKHHRLSGCHPDLKTITEECNERGYEPTFITIFRDVNLASFSSVKKNWGGWLKGHKEPYKKHRLAHLYEGHYIHFYNHVFNSLKDLKPKYKTYALNYSSMMAADSQSIIDQLSKEIDFPLSLSRNQTKNADAKHYTKFKNHGKVRGGEWKERRFPNLSSDKVDKKHFIVLGQSANETQHMEEVLDFNIKGDPKFVVSVSHCTEEVQDMLQTNDDDDREPIVMYTLGDNLDIDWNAKAFSLLDQHQYNRHMLAINNTSLLTNPMLYLRMISDRVGFNLKKGW